MTWRYLLRTLAVASVGTTALILTVQARAEGGNADGLISPDKAEAYLSAAAAEVAAAAEAESAEAAEAETPAKAAKAGDRPKAKDAAKAAKGPESRPAGAQAGRTDEAAAEPADEQAGDQTASLGPVPVDVRSKLRPSDAVRASSMKPLIARYASENDLPYELADAVVRIESRYNAGARNGPNMGLTQINVRTAQSLGYQGSAAGLLDAETNLRYGLKYLARAYKLAGGDTCGTILRYQFGHRTQNMTAASRAYCAKVKVIAAAAE